MTDEPIHTVHLTPHITWQGTQAELEAMQAEGWPDGSAGEIIAACKRDAAEAEAYAKELEAKLAKVIPLLGKIKSHKVFYMEELADLIAELKGDKP